MTMGKFHYLHRQRHACGQGLRSRARGDVAGDERHSACGPEHDQPHLGHRWPHDPSPRLCPEPAYPQADRGGLRLDQSLGRLAQDSPPRARACRMEFHLHRGRLQSDPPPQAAGELMPSRKNPLLGRWRITEMELWDTDFVDMLEPAYITFEATGGGEFVFGAVRGGWPCKRCDSLSKDTSGRTISPEDVEPRLALRFWYAFAPLNR